MLYKYESEKDIASYMIWNSTLFPECNCSCMMVLL